MKKHALRILSIVISVLLAGASFGTFAFAEDTAPWNGSDIAEKFGQGTGTEDDPYLISSGAELAYLASTTNEKTDYTDVYFEQTANIDLNEKPWTPIGGASGSFKGVYDGGGFTVKGLNCDTIALDGDAKEYAGLFGAASGATIMNLTVTGSIVRSNKFAAPIVGYGRNLTNIINCRSEVAYVDGACAGGIAGRIDFSEFNSEERNMVIACVSDSNIFTRCNVSADGSTGRAYTYCGGIVGASIATTVAYCTNNGDLDLIPLENKAYPIWSGGIVGVNGSNLYRSNIYFCTNNGYLKTYTSYDVSSILEQAPGTKVNTYENIMRIGGIAGHFTNKIDNNIVAGCLNNGDIAIYKSSDANAERMSADESTTQRAGGIIGLANKKCISDNNYTVMSPGIAVDNSGSSVEDSITVITADAVKGDAGLTVLERGNTLDSFIGLLVSHSLSNSYYTANEIKAMEEYTDNVPMQEYLTSAAKTQFAVFEPFITDIWQTRSDGEPVISNAETAIILSALFDGVQNYVNEALAILEEGGDPLNPGDITDDPNDTGDISDTDNNDTTTGTTDSTGDTSGQSGSSVQQTTSSNGGKDEKGCGSSVGAVSVTLMAVACIGCAAVALKRRKE